jgi:hypothetical protein
MLYATAAALLVLMVEDLRGMCCCNFISLGALLSVGMAHQLAGLGLSLCM